MHYQGGKSRLAAQVASVIARYRDERPFVEPFVGGGSILATQTGDRYASDANPYTVALLCAVRDGWEPPDVVTEEEYAAIKADPDEHSPHLVGFVGFGCSFGGKFFGGYARNNCLRDYCGVAKRGLLKRAVRLRGASIVHSDFALVRPPSESLVYCDPPYAGTTGYAARFSSEFFWSRCRDWADAGHIVLVSEYSAPEWAVEVWARTVKKAKGTHDTEAKTERIFFVPGRNQQG